MRSNEWTQSVSTCPAAAVATLADSSPHELQQVDEIIASISSGFGGYVGGKFEMLIYFDEVVIYSASSIGGECAEKYFAEYTSTACQSLHIRVSIGMRVEYFTVRRSVIL